MNVVTALTHYVDGVLAGDGVKGLILDDETTRILSLVCTQTQLLDRQVYLTDRLAKKRDKLRHLNATVLVRPTADNVALLCEELRDPRYGAYKLVFTNLLERTHLESLAEADALELVSAVTEKYLDFDAIDPHLFTIGGSGAYRLGPTPDEWDLRWLERTTQGLVAALLALKKRPAIRFQGNSALARRLAEEVSRVLAREERLFDFARNDTPPVLLIVDRRSDPVTPILTQWTYQAMVHDLLGIHNGRVDLSKGKDVRPELHDIVLTSQQDSFFAQNMHLNFGDLGTVVKSYVESYQQRTDSSRNLETIADMKRFIEAYPEFRKLSGNVSKHVALMSELSRHVAERGLLDASEVEQSLACNDAHAQDLPNLRRLLERPDITDDSKLRLVCLYALRYEGDVSNELSTLLPTLPASAGRIVSTLLNVAGQQARRGQADLFPKTDFFSKARSGIRGLKGVENVYTQHRPLLESTLVDLSRARLSRETHPYLPGSSSAAAGAGAGAGAGERPQDAIVFMVGGGVSFEEAKCVHELQQNLKGFRCILGGERVLNADLYFRMLQDGAEVWPLAGKGGAAGRLAARLR